MYAPGVTVTHTQDPNHRAWIQVIEGKVSANGVELNTGDGAANTDSINLTLECEGSAEILLFDLL
jgi:redox-sensitive bicupin YhaK (pirin superfamily)